MRSLRFSTGFVGLAVLTALPSVGVANTYTLHRDDVIPVVFADRLTVKDSRPGDSFTVRVADSALLPPGTEFMGRIERIHPAHMARPASMDLRFVAILLPDHSRVPLDAAPLALDDRYITRFGDGRLVAKQDVRLQQSEILGGAIGGFIVGSIFHHRFLGATVGTMIGISAAEQQRAKDANVIVSTGERVGALINRDVTIDFEEQSSRYDINKTLDHGMADPAHTTPAASQSAITIRVRNRDLSFSKKARPYMLGNTVMVPLERTAGQLKLNVNRQKERTIVVKGSGSSVRLNLSSRGAEMDGRRFDLPRTVIEIGGVIFAPLEALLPLLKDEVFVNGQKVESN